MSCKAFANSFNLVQDEERRIFDGLYRSTVWRTLEEKTCDKRSRMSAAYTVQKISAQGTDL
jgi:hypothetical protein